MGILQSGRYEFLERESHSGISERLAWRIEGRCTVRECQQGSILLLSAPPENSRTRRGWWSLEWLLGEMVGTTFLSVELPKHSQRPLCEYTNQETHQPITPHIFHVHSFGVPYMRLEPWFLLCECEYGVESEFGDAHFADEGRTLFSFLGSSSPSLGVSSYSLVTRPSTACQIASRLHQRRHTSAMALPRRRLGTRRTSWLAARRRKCLGNDCHTRWVEPRLHSMS